MGIRDKPTAPASSWQNGFAERLIGSIRRECVDHFIVLGEAHLRHILRTYARYYNHISERIGLWTKIRRSIAPFSGSDLSNRTRSSADFTITTFAFRFSVHTAIWNPTSAPVHVHAFRSGRRRICHRRTERDLGLATKLGSVGSRPAAACG
jgi:hypothetical protein